MIRCRRGQHGRRRIPALHRLFEELIACQPDVIYEQMGTGAPRMQNNAELTQYLRERKFVKLPLSNAIHESELLVQCGRRQLASGQIVEAPGPGGTSTGPSRT